MNWLTIAIIFYSLSALVIIYLGFRSREKKPENDGFIPGIGRSDSSKTK